MNRRLFLKSFVCAIGGITVGIPIVNSSKNNKDTLDKINLRRVCLTIRRDVSELLFCITYGEFNDSVLREKCTKAVNDYLERLRKFKAFYKYRVVCNEINNTQDTIDNYEIIMDIFLQPKPSMIENYTKISFIINPLYVNGV